MKISHSEWKSIKIQGAEDEAAPYNNYFYIPPEIFFALLGISAYIVDKMRLIGFLWYLAYRCLFPRKPTFRSVIRHLPVKGTFTVNEFKIYVVEWSGIPVFVSPLRNGVDKILYHLTVTVRGSAAAIILRPGERANSRVPVIDFRNPDLDRVVRSVRAAPDWKKVKLLLEKKGLKLEKVVSTSPRYALRVPVKRNFVAAAIFFLLGCIPA